MSLDDLKARIDAIEGGYEFFLAYAAQGLTSDAANKAGTQVRGHLAAFEGALDGLATAFRPHLIKGGGSAGTDSVTAGEGDGAAGDGGTSGGNGGASAEAVTAALEVLRRDADAAVALVRLVAAQPAISSQLIDNLNASIHLRALLTDVFVLGELAGV